MKYYFIILFLFSIILNQDSTVSSDSLESDVFQQDLFESLLTEAKMFYADAIIADLIGDTLDAMYQFDNAFKALTQLELISEKDELDLIKYQKVMTAIIEYYDNKALTIDKTKTGFSTAVFKDKLDEYIYNQSLDDLVVFEETIEVIEGHVPITYNKKVESIIRYYTNQGKRSINRWLSREDKYKEIVLPILEEYDLPPELFYIPMIESGFKSDARSFASAVGPWQFIESTAKSYGLKKNFYYDERQDIVKSTHAACKYLKYLYDQFNDWYLAFAAYNCGETRVHRHIKYFKTNNFWELKNLPRETQNYVPSLMAIIFISKDPEKYGFKITPDKFLSWDLKKINKSVTLEDMSKASKLDIKLLREYNPEILRDYVYVEKDSFYEFKMPVNYSEDFDSLFALIESTRTDQIIFKKHKVKTGESLWSIAIKYGSTITAICEENKLNRNKPLRSGKVITVPIGNYKVPQKTIYHYVKRGDTLSEIAFKYKTSIKKIKKWNKLSSNTIRIGQKIRIYK